MARLRLLRLLLLATSFAAGASCLEKGDTDIELAPGEGEGPAPTCVDVCGRITANDPNWLPCMQVPVKDRLACLERCEALDAGEAALRCAMASRDCNELTECGPVY